MHTSDILVSPTPRTSETGVTKLGQAYLQQRQQLELTEIELKRTKIAMLDEDGQLIRLAWLLDH
ncbi:MULTISPECIES: hypothetical protein [Vibrio]|uniref:Uncharacterized protein n=1 Tax=Vibrio chanodichtyis TaxID=3027932 RepID=A0ABT5UZ21_9VIBR|nr:MULTISPECIES: hypothetical protein [Vibrio]MDE1514067.1 hypothetical protein [Vibrio chanodichtyis]